MVPHAVNAADGRAPAALIVRDARTPDDVAAVRALILEYQASLDVDLAFQHFADEIASLATTYGPPAGALLLATLDGAPAGCVGVDALRPGAVR